MKSVARYRDLVEDTADWIWEMNLDLNYTYSNEKMDLMLGYSTGEIKSLVLDDLLHPADLKDVQDRMPTYIAQGKGWERRLLRYRHKDGHYRCLESTASPVFDPDGAMRGFRGIDRDLTGQFFADEQIRSGEAIFHTMFESANDAIFLMHHETVIDCNLMALKVFEATRDELVGKKPWDFSPTVQSDGVSSEKKGRAYLKEIRSGKPVRFEWVHTKKDGSTVYTDISLNTIKLRAGTRILAILRDITESKRTHEALAHQAEFQRRLAEISAKVASVQPDNANEQITQSLQNICQNYGLASAGIWWFPSAWTASIALIAGMTRTRICRPRETRYLSLTRLGQPD